MLLFFVTIYSVRFPPFRIFCGYMQEFKKVADIFHT